METLESYRVGDRVNLLFGHPWEGRSGVVIGIDYIPEMDKSPILVQLDGPEDYLCYVMKPEWAERIVPKSKRGTEVKVSKRKKALDGER